MPAAGIPLSRKQIPNLVTGTRLLAVPVVWWFALQGHHLVVGAGLFFAWATDALDGFLARRLHANTAWGSQFDTISDSLMFVSGLAWVAMLRPEFVSAYAWLLAIWLAVGAAAYLVCWLRFRRIVNVHLISAKAANFAGFLFAAHLIAFGTYPPAVAIAVLVLLLAAALETLVVVATFDRVDEHVASVLNRREGGGR